MILLQISFTDEEIRKFFEENGFRIEERERGHWRRQYHGADKWISSMEPMLVLPSGDAVTASKVFNLVAEMRIKRNITLNNPGTQSLIEKAIKSLSNNIAL